MSITVCQTPSALFAMESSPTDTLSMMLSQNPTTPTAPATTYIHPLIRRSSSFMSKSSLEICTESLGCETGSGDFSVDDDVVAKQKRRQPENGARGENENRQNSMEYQSSVSRKSVPRSFPPPLSSISSRDGTCIQMRTCRQHGHLVVEAVPVASQNYLNARRRYGRLQLSFIDSTATPQSTADVNVYADKSERTTLETRSLEEKPVEQVAEAVASEIKKSDNCQEEAEDEEDEEEVEVVDRGSMVEVKVSTQPGSAQKVLRSSLVINKFVGGAPLTNQNRWAETLDDASASQQLSPHQPPFRSTTTTAAAAAVAASSASSSSEAVAQKPTSVENKLLYTSKRSNREEMLNQMRRCSELRRSLFFWEAGGTPSSDRGISC